MLRYNKTINNAGVKTMTKEVILDGELVIKAVKAAKSEKEAFKKYAWLASRKTLTAGQRAKISAVFQLNQEAEKARQLEEYEIREAVEAQMAAEFAPVIEQYKKTISQFLTMQLDGKGTFTIALTDRCLQVKINVPAIWSDAASITAYLDRSADFDLSYGCGGENSGFSKVEVARQKAFALNVACDLVEEITGFDWTPFTRYRKTVTDRTFAKLKELAAKE
jgi:hypothetical protein